MPGPAVDPLNAGELETLRAYLNRLAGNVYWMDVPYEPALTHIRNARRLATDALTVEQEKVLS